MNKVLVNVAITLVIAFPVLAIAATQQTIYTFNGTNGTEPYGGLVSDSSGNLYGTTEFGGASNLGTVFELSLGQNGTWTETLLYSFKGHSIKDGDSPESGVVRDSAGNLYGTTANGGSSGLCSGGCGTAFELSPNGLGGWTERILYSFYGKKGEYPSGLIMDTKGNLYGTTMAGGTGTSCTNGCGTVFQLKRNLNGTWTETVLHSFASGTDGSLPYAGLALDKSGNLYGTTVLGGGNAVCAYGCGTVFRVSQTAKIWTETVIYSFGFYNDGAYPYAPVIIDSAGNLYGTTFGGGNFGAASGVVFQLVPDNGGWTQSVLHTLNSTVDGAQPYFELILDGSGNLYGTTSSGSVSNNGVVFELIPAQGGSWTEVLLYAFPPNGIGPTSGLTWNGAQTVLFGTASLDSTDGNGIVYEVTP